MPNITNYPIVPLPGTRSKELGNNPDRGMRMELYMQVGNGLSIFEYSDRDAIECLHEEVEKYSDENPRLAQVYFYLTDFWNRPLDEAAFERMNAYFYALEKLSIKALLRFAYLCEEDEFTGRPITSPREPEPWQIAAHLRQLSFFLHRWKKQIHVLQAGMIGVWGEWDLFARDRNDRDALRVNGVTAETAVLNALLESMPQDMYLQVRYMNIKSANLKPNSTYWKRVGFHDDFLIGEPHVWNTAGGVPGSFEWCQMEEQARFALVDGEMIWGASNKVFHGDTSINALLMARRLQEHHFTSFSLAHNYRERDGIFSMVEWQGENISPEQLDKNGLRYHPAWFRDESGAQVKRTSYEYIRDYLGYYIVLEESRIWKESGAICAELTLKNYGFAAPLGLVFIDMALLNENAEIVAQTSLVQPADLQPGVAIKATAVLPQSSKGLYIGMRMQNSAGTSASLANVMVEQKNEWQLLAQITQ